MQFNCNFVKNLKGIGPNPVAVDLVCAKMIGFDYKKIPTLMRALNSKKYELFGEDLQELVIESESTISFDEIHNQFCFDLKPTASWRGHIEAGT